MNYSINHRMLQVFHSRSILNSEVENEEIIESQKQNRKIIHSNQNLDVFPTFNEASYDNHQIG